MLTLSEIMAASGRRGKGQAKRRVPSTSHGPVVVLKGWREGMNKVGVTRLLREHGVLLSEAYEATDAVLAGREVSIHLPVGTNTEALRRDLANLGVVT
jgi:hypothetical protein